MSEKEKIEEKKNWLRRYRKNRACLGRLEEKLKTLEERMKSAKSPNYSGMPRGGKPVTIDELMSDKIELEQRIERMDTKGCNIKSEILCEIDSLDDVRYAEILELFFVGCMTFEEIAADMGYSVRRVVELYSEAIKKLISV